MGRRYATSLNRGRGGEEVYAISLKRGRGGEKICS